MHKFTDNEREISIPHEAASCGIENFEFIVSERVQVNPDNSRAMGALTFLLFKLNTLQKINRQTLSQPKPWCNDNLHHGYYTTVMTSTGCCVITQCHVVQINQLENQNSYGV